MTNLQQLFNQHTTTENVTVREINDEINVKEDSAVYCAFSGRREKVLYLFKILQLLNNKYDLKTITEMYQCLDMAYSILCYSIERNIDNLLQDRYIKEFNLSDDIKRVILEVAIDSIESITPNVYEDCEGCTYNSMKIKPIIL